MATAMSSRTEKIRRVLDIELISRQESRRLDRACSAYRSECDRVRSCLRRLESFARCPNQDLVAARLEAREEIKGLIDYAESLEEIIENLPEIDD